MNIQMMEGLVGANTSARLSDISMDVYRRASAEGDTEKMKRALEYTGDCTEKAVKYQEKLHKGMKAEAEAEREKTKLENEAAKENRREESRKTGDGTESECLQKTDVVQISETAKEAGKSGAAGAEVQPAGEPVLYTETGAAVALGETGFTVSFSA